MWWIATLLVVAVLLTPLGLVLAAFLPLRRLTKLEEINGMAIVKDGFVCAGLVPLGNREVALVDAGNDRRAKALLAELAGRGFGPDDVKAILLTHGHGDHTGGVRHFPKAEIMGLEAEAEVVEGRSTGGGPLLRLRSLKPTGIRLTRTSDRQYELQE